MLPGSRVGITSLKSLTTMMSILIGMMRMPILLLTRVNWPCLRSRCERTWNI